MLLILSNGKSSTLRIHTFTVTLNKLMVFATQDLQDSDNLQRSAIHAIMHPSGFTNLISLLNRFHTFMNGRNSSSQVLPSLTWHQESSVLYHVSELSLAGKSLDTLD